MPIYDVIAIQNPTKEEAEKGTLENIIFGPKTLVAKTPEAARMKAIKEVPNEADLDRVEVKVRPFV